MMYAPPPNNDSNRWTLGFGRVDIHSVCFQSYAILHVHFYFFFYFFKSQYIFSVYFTSLKIINKMAGSIIDNAAIYKKKTFAYVPPSAPAPLLDSTSFTLDFTARKFLLVGIDPTDNFQTVIHLLTSSRHVKLSTDFLKRIFSLMGNVLSFILDIPQSYKRTIFLETDFYKLSSMVYGGINVLVIESKTEDGCRILLNRADLIQLQRLEWSISASIGEKVVFIKPKIIKEMNQYCDYLAKQFLQVDSPKPQNVHEMLIFINNEEDKQSSQNQYLSQIKMFASTQLAELCMTRLKTQNSQVVIQIYLLFHNI